MSRLLWVFAWIAVAVWSLFAFSAYGLVDLFGGFVARNADAFGGDPELVEWLFWLFNGEKWEHFAMILHPTQPLMVLNIESELDAGATGRQFRKMLLARLAAKKVIEVSDDDVLRRVEKDRHRIYADADPQDVAAIVHKRLGRGTVVWGNIRQEEDVFILRLRGMDVRDESSVTKLWPSPREWRVPAHMLEAQTEDIAAYILFQVYEAADRGWLCVCGAAPAV